MVRYDEVVGFKMQDVVDRQGSLLPVNPNKPRQGEQWLVWVVVAAMIFYSLAVGLGLMVAATAGRSVEWAFPLMSVPCFITAIWYEYTYLSSRSSGRDGGLALSGVGWAAVGMAFLFKRDLSQAESVWSNPSFWWGLLAMACIIGGAVVSILGRRRPRAVLRPPREPAQNRSPQPPEKKE
jgi:hypothetical protein